MQQVVEWELPDDFADECEQLDYLETFYEALAVRHHGDSFSVIREYYADGSLVSAREIDVWDLDVRYQVALWDALLAMEPGDSIDLQPTLNQIDRRYNRLDRLYDDVLPCPAYHWWGIPF